MSATQPEAPTAELRDLELALIDPNPGNPRLVFPQEELDKLAESISNEGVLVPIVVYEKAGRFVLVDGERRFKCALLLGLDTIPAVITGERSEQDTLVQMFNIHLIREPWRDMPTAKALGRLIAALQASGQGDVSDSQLRDMTGMSTERIKQLRYALALPPEWQEHIDNGDIPLNWFWELEKNVIRPLAKQRPALLDELGSSSVVEAFVNKRLEGITATDSVSLRKIRPIINYAGADAEASGKNESFLDDTIRSLVNDPDLTIDDAYEDTVQIMVEADKLERRTNAMLANFDRLLNRARTAEERQVVKDIGEKFVDKLTELLGTG